jgi:uncharacterized delta-60 repeat protein
VTITFSEVTNGGSTTITVNDEGPPSPIEFQLYLGLYYEITTTATYTGPITICINYDDAGLSPDQEANLKLMYFDETVNAWVDITTSLDTLNNIICGETDHLTDFGLMYEISSIKEQWVKRYDGLGGRADEASALAVDASGNVYVTGLSFSIITNYDYATIKYDPDGNELWVKRYDGPGSGIDEARALAVDDAGNVYVTGRSDGGSTDYDYATIKYDLHGHKLWERRFDAENRIDEAIALAVDNAENVYVTGKSDGGSTGYDYATIKYDIDGNEQWVKRYNDPENWGDRATALAVDASGNIYVTGVSSNSLTGSDYITIKYDPAGNELWVEPARYDGTGTDLATALAVDASGNIYVTGSSSIIYSDSNYDYATIKYDTDGNELWVKRYNGPENSVDLARALAVDASGNVYVTGSSLPSSGGSSYDYATIKYDTDGNEQWVEAARYNGPGNGLDEAYALAVDVFGNIYVTGFSLSSGPHYDYATIKYDPDGNQLWVKRYDAENRIDKAYDLVVDASGNIYVTGGSGVSGTNFDYTTIKYDPDGNELWVGWYTGLGNSGDSAADLAVDSSGNVYVTGSSFGGLETGTDYTTIKYDPDGNALWQRRYNGPGNNLDLARSIAVDSSGNIYVTGTSFGIDADYGRLDFDYATIKYDPAGRELWVRRYDGGPGSSSDDPSALVIDSSGNIYVTGYSRGIYNSDYATIKYDQDGNELWVKRYDRRDDFATALAVDASGNVYVTGSSYTIYADYRQDTDYVTIKYDPDGNELWMEAARYDGPGYRHSIDIARSIAVDDAGNIYVTGHSNGSGTEADYATIKYDPDGNQLWVKRYDGDLENSWDSAIALALDSSGNIYVTGYSNGSGTDRDYTTIKYDPTGNEQWIKRYDGPGNDDDVAADLAVDSSDNIYVTGYSNGSGTKYDYATIKYDPAGKEQWVKRYNGPGNSWDWATALAVDSSGNIYVTGESRGRGTHADYATIKYVNILTISDTDTGVTMTFSEVTSVGSTTITVSNEGPSPPTGFQLNGVYYEITTTATFIGPITICINYDDPSDQDLVVELELRQYNETTGIWDIITTSIDTDNNVICGETTHLSYFGVMYDITPPEITVLSPTGDPPPALQDGVTFRIQSLDVSGTEWVELSIREPGGQNGIIIDPAFEMIPATYVGNDEWQLAFDTTLLPDGYYILFVEASDVFGNADSVIASFSIRNWATLELLPATEDNKAGRVMPIKFSLRVVETVDPTMPFVWNEELTIIIYDKDNPLEILQTSTFGGTSTDYRLDSEGEHYITNFKTPKKRLATYVVEIWRKGMLIGFFEFHTVK